MDMNFSIFLLLIALTSNLTNVEAAFSATLEANLRTAYLGASYNNQIRPTERVNVSCALNLITLNALSITDQTLEIAGYLTMVWTDGRLDWSADATYNTDVQSIYSTEDYIWRPALIIENSISDISVVSSTTVPMRVVQNGEVTWNPSGIYRTHCNTDVTFYPFDTQECDVIVTTWGYTSIEINLDFDASPVRLDYYHENGEWEYKFFSTSSETGSREGESTPELTYTLKFKRRPFFIVLNQIVPMVLLAVLSAMVFKLPSDSGEKLGYALTVLLAYAVYLTIISDNLPSTSTSTSILSLYLVIVLALGVISVIITIYVLDWHHKDDSHPVPQWLKKLTLGCFVKLACWKDYRCCCGRKIEPTDQTNGFEKVDKEEIESDITWKDISYITDVFFYRLYLIIIACITFILIITLVIGYAVK